MADYQDAGQQLDFPCESCGTVLRFTVTTAMERALLHVPCPHCNHSHEFRVGEAEPDIAAQHQQQEANALAAAQPGKKKKGGKKGSVKASEGVSDPLWDEAQRAAESHFARLTMLYYGPVRELATVLPAFGCDCGGRQCKTNGEVTYCASHRLCNPAATAAARRAKMAAGQQQQGDTAGGGMMPPPPDSALGGAAGAAGGSNNNNNGNNGPSPVTRGCLTCKRLFCMHCFECGHGADVQSDCYTLPIATITHTRTLFASLAQGLPEVACRLLRVLAATHSSMQGQKPLAASITMIATKLCSKYGADYRVTFEALLYELAVQERALTSAAAAGASAMSAIEASRDKWHAMGGCGRRLYDWQVWWGRSSGASQFPICRSLIANVAATHGDNIAHFFTTLRFFLLLNALIAALVLGLLVFPALSQAQWPPATLPAVLMGEGLETSLALWGGYYDRYNNGWRMSVAWMLVFAFVLFLSLVAIVAGVESRTIAQGTGSGSAGRELLLCETTLGQIDHSLTDKSLVQRSRLAILTNAEIASNVKAISQRRMDTRVCCTGPCDPWYWWFGFSAAFIALSVWGIYELGTWVADGNAPGRWPVGYAPLFFPVVVALSKFVTPYFLTCCVVREYADKTFTYNTRMTAYFWRLVLQRLALAGVAVYLINAWPAPAYMRSVTDRLMWSGPGGTQECVCLDPPTCADVACKCDESAVGAAYYMYVLADMVITTVLTLLWSGCKVCCRNFMSCCGCRSRASGGTAKEYQSRERALHNRNLFEPLEHIVDLLYRQVFVWSGMYYAPVLPVMVAVWYLVHFAAKLCEVKTCGRRAHMPYAIEKQRLAVRVAMLLTALASFVPISFFMTRTTGCGPWWRSARLGLSISDTFALDTTNMATWVRTVYDYLTNVVILWMVIIVGAIYLLTMSRQVAMAGDARDDVHVQIRHEIADRAHLIKTKKIDASADDRARRTYQAWIAALGRELRPAGEIIRKRVPEFARLIGHTDEQLIMLFKRHANVTEMGADIMRQRLWQVQVQEQQQQKQGGK